MAAAEARCKQEWARASLVASMIVNMHRDPKKTAAIGLDHFNPFREKAADSGHAQPDIKMPISVLKTVFVDQRL